MKLRYECVGSNASGLLDVKFVRRGKQISSLDRGFRGGND
jgi:hypothetical protein